MSKTSAAASRQKLVRLVLTALLTALIIVMAFTPLGYLKAGAIEITFITIPVIIGAVLLGPVGGLFLGAVFGITSFIQCFGMSTFRRCAFQRQSPAHCDRLHRAQSSHGLADGSYFQSDIVER